MRQAQRSPCPSIAGDPAEADPKASCDPWAQTLREKPLSGFLVWRLIQLRGSVASFPYVSCLFDLANLPPRPPNRSKMSKSSRSLNLGERDTEFPPTILRGRT